MRAGKAKSLAAIISLAQAFGYGTHRTQNNLFRKYTRRTSKYTPHQGAGECARRRKQMRRKVSIEFASALAYKG